MFIKNNVMGKKITRTYEFNIKRDSEGLLMEKPKLDFKNNIEWVNILTFNGTNIRSNGYRNYKISIGENEEEKDIEVFKEEFRSDKNEMFLYTEKEIELIEKNKYDSEQALAKIMCNYNKKRLKKIASCWLIVKYIVLFLN